MRLGRSSGPWSCVLLGSSLFALGCDDGKVSGDAGVDAPSLPDCGAVEAGVLAEAGAEDDAGAEGGTNDKCQLGDQDGVSGGTLTFDLTATDTGYSPVILKAENGADVTLTFKNMGTVPHGFAVQCIPTPNDDGCPTRSCFPNEAAITPIAPGMTATVKFRTPAAEGTYIFGADPPCSGMAGQFIVD
jgi:hypothetical protein